MSSDLHYPWRRYKDFPPIPDYVDAEGRHYVSPSALVQEEFGKSGNETYELKLPRNAALDFPELGSFLTLFAWNNRRLHTQYVVREMFFLPRGATGVILIYKDPRHQQ